MNYPPGMDKECIPLCDAINSIPGLYTIESCCGHGERPFRVWFRARYLGYLPILLYYCDPPHNYFLWHCEVETDEDMEPVCFCLESESTGEKAYTEASFITRDIMAFLEANKADMVFKEPFFLKKVIA